MNKIVHGNINNKNIDIKWTFDSKKGTETSRSVNTSIESTATVDLTDAIINNFDQSYFFDSSFPFKRLDKI